MRMLFFFAMFLKKPLKVIEAKKANKNIERAKALDMVLFYNRSIYKHKI